MGSQGQKEMLLEEELTAFHFQGFLQFLLFLGAPKKQNQMILGRVQKIRYLIDLLGEIRYQVELLASQIHQSQGVQQRQHLAFIHLLKMILQCSRLVYFILFKDKKTLYFLILIEFAVNYSFREQYLVYYSPMLSNFLYLELVCLLSLLNP